MGVENKTVAAHQPADVRRIGELGSLPSKWELGEQIEQVVEVSESGGIEGFYVALRRWQKHDGAHHERSS